jgi:hypothetical protein
MQTSNHSSLVSLLGSWDCRLQKCTPHPILPFLFLFKFFIGFHYIIFIYIYWILLFNLFSTCVRFVSDVLMYCTCISILLLYLASQFQKWTVLILFFPNTLCKAMNTVDRLMNLFVRYIASVYIILTHWEERGRDWERERVSWTICLPCS